MPGQRRTNRESRVMEDNLKRALFLFALLMMLASSSGLWAQQAGYSQTNLVSNTAGLAHTTDTQLPTPGNLDSSGARFLDRQQQQRHLYAL